ncbi:MAG: agmatine deiminase family protein [Planctomycetota bacterium]
MPYLPTEWHPVDAVWVVPPHNPETWPGCFDQAQQQHADWCTAMQQAGINVRTPADLGIPTNDSWIRDFGPLFTFDQPTYELQPTTYNLSIQNHTFNTWGNKYEPRPLDNAVPEKLAAALDLPLTTHDLVLEGGSIETNGHGTLLTTSACLLHPNRNPHLTQPQLEAHLQHTLGVQQIVWLPHALAGDDTDGHIDDLARFTTPNTLVAVTAHPGHPDHAATAANLHALRQARDLDRSPFHLLELPAPQPIYYDFPQSPQMAQPSVGSDRQPLPASYANFLLANRHCFVPVFNQATDDPACRVLETALPNDFTVVPIPAQHLIVGLGALHCLSMQQPAPHP